METGFKTYHSLMVYQEAESLAFLVYKLTKKFPPEELFGITSQLRRSATSIPANIAEGYSRNTPKDKIRFFNMAQGSLVELRFFLEFSNKLGYLEMESLAKLQQQILLITKLICGFIKKINNNSRPTSTLSPDTLS